MSKYFCRYLKIVNTSFIGHFIKDFNLCDRHIDQQTHKATFNIRYGIIIVSKRNPVYYTELYTVHTVISVCLIFSPFVKTNNIKMVRQFVLLHFKFIFFPKQIQTYFSQIIYRLKSNKVIQIRFPYNLYRWDILVSTQLPTKKVLKTIHSIIYYFYYTSESPLPASTGNVIVLLMMLV